MEKWKRTPEGYRDLINSVIDMMTKEEAWERMLSRLYSCANRLWCTNGYESPGYHDASALRAYTEQLRAQVRAELDEVTA